MPREHRLVPAASCAHGADEDGGQAAGRGRDERGGAVKEGRWVDDATSGPEGDLRAGLADARARVPDEVALRRLWGKVAHPDLGRPVRPRWTWFAGGVISSAALGLALAFFFWPGRSPQRAAVASA